MKPVTNWDALPVIFDLPMAARIDGRAVDTLKKLAQKGQYPAVKVGGQWRVCKEKLKAFLQGEH